MLLLPTVLLPNNNLEWRPSPKVRSMTGAVLSLKALRISSANWTLDRDRWRRGHCVAVRRNRDWPVHSIFPQVCANQRKDICILSERLLQIIEREKKKNYKRYKTCQYLIHKHKTNEPHVGKFCLNTNAENFLDIPRPFCDWQLSVSIIGDQVPELGSLVGPRGAVLLAAGLLLPLPLPPPATTPLSPTLLVFGNCCLERKQSSRSIKAKLLPYYPVLRIRNDLFRILI